MIEAVISWIESIVVPWGMWGVFVGSVTEEIVFMIPSALTQMGYGFLLYSEMPFSLENILKFSFSVPVFASFGVLIGSLPYYFLARFIGKQFFGRYGKYIGLGSNAQQKIDDYLEKTTFDEKFLIIGRFIPLVPSVFMAILPGLLHISLKKYVIYSLVGVYVRSLFLGLVGWGLGSGYKEYAQIINKNENIWGPILFVIIFIYIYRHIKKSGILKTN